MTTTSPQSGENLLRAYRLDTDADTLPILTTRSLQGPQITAVHFAVTQNQLGLLAQVPLEDTFAVGVNFTGLRYNEVWSKRRLIINNGLLPNALTSFNLADEMAARVTQPYEAVCLLIRRSSLDAFAEEEEYRRIHNLSIPYGIIDQTMTLLCKALLPYFARPQVANALYVEHVNLAITAHLIDYYGDSSPGRAATAKGGLSPSLVRRVQEMLMCASNDNLHFVDIAKACDISRTYLIKAFKKTTGLTPHQWLLQQRVNQAKDKLANTNMPISHIAALCGFRDQSHLTTVFSTQTQVTPAAWRQRNQSKLNSRYC